MTFDVNHGNSQARKSAVDVLQPKAATRPVSETSNSGSRIQPKDHPAFSSPREFATCGGKELPLCSRPRPAVAIGILATR
jgi:hypothetical protein